MKKFIILVAITACSTNQKEPFRLVDPSNTMVTTKPIDNTGNQVSASPTSADLCFYPEGVFELVYTPTSSNCDEINFINREPLVQILDTQKPPFIDCIGTSTVVNTKDKSICEISTSTSCEDREFTTKLVMVNDTQAQGNYIIQDKSCIYEWEIVGRQIDFGTSE